MESISFEPGFSYSSNPSNPSPTLSYEVLEEELSKLFKKQHYAPTMAESAEETETSTSMAFQELENEPSPALHPTENQPHLIELKKPIPSRLKKLRDKIKTPFKRRGEKELKIWKKSLDEVERERIQDIINSDLNSDREKLEQITKSIHIFIINTNDKQLQLSFEPIDQFRLAGKAIGISLKEQDMLLNFADPGTVIKEAFETSVKNYKALENLHREKKDLESLSSRKKLAFKQLSKNSRQLTEKNFKKELKEIENESTELPWVFDDFIPNATLDNLEISHTPALYIEMTKRTETIILKYTCFLGVQSETEVYEFRKICVLSRYKEDPELMAIEYHVNRA